MSIMPVTRRLLITPSPLPDENFIGYILRLTESNRFDTPSWILRVAKIRGYVRSNLSFAFDSSLNLSSLSKLTGVEERDLKVLLYSAVSANNGAVSEYVIYGAAVPRYM